MVNHYHYQPFSTTIDPYQPLTLATPALPAAVAALCPFVQPSLPRAAHCSLRNPWRDHDWDDAMAAIAFGLLTREEDSQALPEDGFVHQRGKLWSPTIGESL